MKSSVQIEQPPLSVMMEELDTIGESSTVFPATVQVSVPELQAWPWLNSNASVPRVAWVDRSSNDVLAGVGVASQVEVRPKEDPSFALRRCRELLMGSETLRFFGGFSFDGSDCWSSLGAGKFVIPRLTLSGGVLTLAVMNQQDVELAREDLRALRISELPLDASIPTPVSKRYQPTFNGWQSRVDESLALIAREVVEKIVLSRKTELTFEHPLNSIALAASLHAATHDCFVFCFNFGDDTTFVGATPERLFHREGKFLQSEVVAGTRMRGATPEEDERLSIELLTSDKDQREHDIVRKSIRQKLHQFIEHLDVDSQASILRLARKQHLRSNVHGELKAEVDDGKLLSRLHPTPAVGGYPTENALPEISRIEPYNRGWYAAPVGWIGADNAQFAVAIRSGLVEGNTLSLFSGAGIVRGSEPEQEWYEVENKIQDFLSIIGS